MERLSMVAFDDYVTGPGPGALAISNAEDFAKLAIFDQIGFTVTVEQVSGSSPKIEVYLSHSADGINFVSKNPTAEVPLQAIVAGVTNVLVGFDDGTRPSLQYVAFNIAALVTTGPIKLRVRIDATTNDYRESAFAVRMKRLLRESHDLSGCKHIVQGGTPWKSFPAELKAVAQGMLTRMAYIANHHYGDAAAIARAEKMMTEYFGMHYSVGTRPPQITEAVLDPRMSACIKRDGTVVFSGAGKSPLAISQPSGASATGGQDGPSC